MPTLVLRFQSLALHEDAVRSTIHFEVEGEDAIAPAHAEIVDCGDGRVKVGAPRVVGKGLGREAFEEAVQRIYTDQVRLVERLAGAARAMSCIVALRDVVTIELGREAYGQ